MPPSPLADAKYLRAIPPFLSNDSNEDAPLQMAIRPPQRYQDMIRTIGNHGGDAAGQDLDERKAQASTEHAVRVHRDNGTST